MKRIFATFLLIALLLTACAQPGSTSTAGNQTTPPQTTAPVAQATTAPPSTAPPATSPATAPAQTTAPPATEYPQTAVPPPASTQADEQPALTVSLTITCKIGLDSGQISADKLEILPEDGIILRVEKAELQDGDTVFDLLQRECKSNRVHLEFVKTPALGTAYIEGIGNLYELDAGPLSGWVFTVNGQWPGNGSSSVTLAPGDAVEWIYTTDLGRDVGAPDAALGG